MKEKQNSMKAETFYPFDGFFEWLETEAGEDAMQAIDDVAAAFEGADVDIHERRIIWADGERLTINESAKRIQEYSEVPLKVIKWHIVLWLQMDFVPQGLNEEQMQGFETQIDDWIHDYETRELNRV